jgi:hypothetical protein
MTLKEIFELAQQHNSEIGLTEVTRLANRWLRDFAYRTRILYGQDTSITTTASTDSYAIPSTMFIIEKVRVDDEFIPPVVGDYVIGEAGSNRGWTMWQTDGDTIRFVKDSSTLSYLDADLDVVLYGYKYDTALVAATLTTSAPTFPEQFHEAISFGVLSSMYMTPPLLNPDMARVYRAEYERVVREGKRYARSHRHKAGTAIPVFY